MCMLACIRKGYISLYPFIYRNFMASESVIEYDKHKLNKMKTSIIISVLLASTLSVFSQNLDLLGFPTDENQNIKLENNQVPVLRTVDESEEPVIINSFPTPVNYSCGMAFDGELLWISGYAEYQLFGLNPDDGSVVETIPINITRPYGIAYSNGVFYILDNDNHLIQKIDRYTGNEIGQILLEDNGATYPTGVELVNGDIWYNDPRGPYAYSSSDDLVRNYNTTNDSFTDYNAIGDYPTALAYDGESLWSMDNALQLIHKVNKQTLQSEKTIHAPGGIYPNGLAFDGEFMWVSNNDSDSIYKMSIEDVAQSVINPKNNSIDNEVKVFPTISNYTFNINLGKLQAENVKIELISIDGHTVDVINHVSSSELVWQNTKGLADGLYFFRINYNNQSIIKKMIIRK